MSDEWKMWVVSMGSNILHAIVLFLIHKEICSCSSSPYVRCEVDSNELRCTHVYRTRLVQVKSNKFSKLAQNA